MTAAVVIAAVAGRRPSPREQHCSRGRAARVARPAGDAILLPRVAQGPRLPLLAPGPADAPQHEGKLTCKSFHPKLTRG